MANFELVAAVCSFDDFIERYRDVTSVNILDKESGSFIAKIPPLDLANRDVDASKEFAVEVTFSKDKSLEFICEFYKELKEKYSEKAAFIYMVSMTTVPGTDEENMASTIRVGFMDV